MSRLFEFLQNLNASPARASDAALRAEAEEILSVVQMPKPTKGSLAPAAVTDFPADEIEIKDSDRLAYITDPSGPAADKYRMLRMRLRLLASTTKLQKILITSPLPKDYGERCYERDDPSTTGQHPEYVVYRRT